LASSTDRSSILEKTVETMEKEKPESVKQLFFLLKKQLSFHDEEIVNFVLKLQEEGVIRFEQQSMQAPQNLVSYLKKPSAYWYWVIVAFTSVASTIFFTIPENAYPWVYVRYFFAAVFALWFPGYTLMKILFPHVSHAENQIGVIERACLSIGLSLAIVPVVGLLLNYTPWGIRLTPIVLSLVALTLTLATIAIIREYQSHATSSK
jgi:hypothetical protein